MICQKAAKQSPFLFRFKDLTDCGAKSFLVLDVFLMKMWLDDRCSFCREWRLE